MVEGVRYGGSVAEVGAAGWLGGQVGTTRAPTVAQSAHTAQVVGSREAPLVDH